MDYFDLYHQSFIFLSKN